MRIGMPPISALVRCFIEGDDILSGFGSCYNAVGMSAEMMLIQTAWLDAAEHMGKGINICTSALGLENIKKAGPGGNFLTDDLTLKNLRSGEFFFNDLFDLSGSEEKSRSMLERAHEKVEELVSEATSPLQKNVREDLKRYFHDKFKR